MLGTDKIRRKSMIAESIKTITLKEATAFVNTYESECKRSY